MYKRAVLRIFGSTTLNRKKVRESRQKRARKKDKDKPSKVA